MLFICCDLHGIKMYVTLIAEICRNIVNGGGRSTSPPPLPTRHRHSSSHHFGTVCWSTSWCAAVGLLESVSVWLNKQNLLIVEESGNFKIKFFGVLTPCGLVNSYQHIKGLLFLYLQGQAVCHSSWTAGP